MKHLYQKDLDVYFATSDYFYQIGVVESIFGEEKIDLQNAKELIKAYDKESHIFSDRGVQLVTLIKKRQMLNTMVEFYHSSGQYEVFSIILEMLFDHELISKLYNEDLDPPENVAQSIFYLRY